jgi:hypothetical protein
VTSAVTKSGTNERHGSALLFAQAGVLNDQAVFAALPGGGSARTGSRSVDRLPATHVLFRQLRMARLRSSNFVVSPAPQAEGPTTRTSTWRS